MWFQWTWFFHNDYRMCSLQIIFHASNSKWNEPPTYPKNIINSILLIRNFKLVVKWKSKTLKGGKRKVHKRKTLHILRPLFFYYFSFNYFLTIYSSNLLTYTPLNLSIFLQIDLFIRHLPWTITTTSLPHRRFFHFKPPSFWFHLGSLLLHWWMLPHLLMMCQILKSHKNPPIMQFQLPLPHFMNNPTFLLLKRLWMVNKKTFHDLIWWRRHDLPFP